MTTTAIIGGIIYLAFIATVTIAIILYATHKRNTTDTKRNRSLFSTDTIDRLEKSKKS